MADTEPNGGIEAEPFTPHTVKMLVSPEMLADMLRLPPGAVIHDVVLKQEAPHYVSVLHFYVHMDAPARAAAMEPTYHRSTGWPDPIHLHEINWVDLHGKRIGGELRPPLPRPDHREHRTEQHPHTRRPPAGPPIDTVVPDTRPSVGMDRCPHVLVFEPARNQPDEQCALYAGHLERHETQPLAPIREDKADGVHMFLWTSDANGNITEINEQKIDDDPDETLGELDV